VELLKQNPIKSVDLSSNATNAEAVALLKETPKSIELFIA
jgi:hypothetical protein